MIKKHYVLILIPIIFAILVFIEKDFIYRAGVSASCALMLIFLPDRNLTKNSVWMVIAALFISIAADWFLCHKNGSDMRFIYGIILFFAAHCGYLAFSLRNGSLAFKVLFVLVIVYLLFFVFMLVPDISNPLLLAAVLLYLLISCLSVSGAVGLVNGGRFTRWMFTSGIGILAFSDTIIALKDFLGYREYGFLILPTYFASHILITIALMRKST